MTFGERMKFRRKLFNWSQAVLSKKTGIPQTTINDLENNKYLPNIAQAKNIASALGVSVSELLDDDEQPEAKEAI